MNTTLARTLPTALIVIASSARADIASWLRTGDPIDGPGGNGIIDPGETATFRLAIDLDPGPGGAASGGETVVAFASVIANFINVKNWNTGNVTWSMNPDLVFLTGDLTYKDPDTQNLYNVNAGQVPDYGPFSSADPMSIITINWDPQGQYAPRTVEFTARAENAGTINTWLRAPGVEYDTPARWPLSDAAFRFDVVPAPGAPALLAPVALAVLRRRR